ncbi:hypothetical protein, partial [Veillonella montpellierensis]|uniref:hypothetical protein n=1 Tax=Veillonella montpellierensis TaxID=187328 RepID=UPI0005700A25
TKTKSLASIVDTKTKSLASIVDTKTKSLASTIDTKVKSLASTVDTKIKDLATTIDTKTKVPTISDMDLIFDGSKFNGGFGAWGDVIEFIKPWDTYDTLYIIYFNGDRDYIYSTTINVAITKRMLEVAAKKSCRKLTVIESGLYKAITPESTSTKWVNYSANMHILYIYGYKQGGQATPKEKITESPKKTKEELREEAIAECEAEDPEFTENNPGYCERHVRVP